jgi:hypothetical protein
MGKLVVLRRVGVLMATMEDKDLPSAESTVTWINIDDFFSAPRSRGRVFRQVDRSEHNLILFKWFHELCQPLESLAPMPPSHAFFLFEGEESFRNTFC